MLTHIIAHFCDLEASDFYYHLGNCHIYDDHIDSLKKQIKKRPFCFPKLNINKKHDKIEDYTIDDFSIIDYQHHKTIKNGNEKVIRFIYVFLLSLNINE